MANSRSALKRVRTAEKRRLRNKQVKSKIKSSVRNVQRALAENHDADELFRRAIKTIDKAVSKGVLHPNTAARKKSQLHRQYNKERVTQ